MLFALPYAAGMSGGARLWEHFPLLQVNNWRFWSNPSRASSGSVLGVTPRSQAAGGNQQIQENDGLMGDQTNLNAALEKVRFQFLMGAYNSEDAFYVTLQHLQANWPGRFNKVMNTTQDAKCLWSRGVENSKAQGQNKPTPSGRNQTELKKVLRTTAAAELAI